MCSIYGIQCSNKIFYPFDIIGVMWWTKEYRFIYSRILLIRTNIYLMLFNCTFTDSIYLSECKFLLSEGKVTDNLENWWIFYYINYLSCSNTNLPKPDLSDRIEKNSTSRAYNTWINYFILTFVRTSFTRATVQCFRAKYSAALATFFHHRVELDR